MLNNGGRRARRVFSEEFRAGAVRLVLEEGKSASSVARDLDLFSRFVVGWAISAVNDWHLAMRALDAAIKRRCPGVGLLHPSDQSSPYASEDYQAVLLTEGITCRMSRCGNCYDNVLMESFFSTVKGELGDRSDSNSKVKMELFDLIEVLFNRRRRHSTMGQVSPAASEKAWATQAEWSNRPRKWAKLRRSSMTDAQYIFELCPECLASYRGLSYDPEARMVASYIPHSMILWNDEHPAPEGAERPHPRCRATIATLLAARLGVWMHGQVPEECQALWADARNAVPKWPGFQRLSLTPEQRDATLECWRLGQQLRNDPIALFESLLTDEEGEK